MVCAALRATLAAWTPVCISAYRPHAARDSCRSEGLRRHVAGQAISDMGSQLMADSSQNSLKTFLGL
jgi:hypothetical protein